MYSVENFTPSQHSVREYKLLAEIACDRLANTCNVDNELTDRSHYNTSFSYRIDLASDDPVYRILYDFIDNTSSVNLAEKVKSLIGERKFANTSNLTVVLHYVTYVLKNEINNYDNVVNKSPHIEQISKKDMLDLAKRINDRENGDEYIKRVTMRLQKVIRELALASRTSNIMVMYCDTSYWRVGMRLSYKSMYKDKMNQTAVDFYTNMEIDFKSHIISQTYYDSTDIYRVQNFLGAIFQSSFIKTWRKTHYTSGLVYSSTMMNDSGEVKWSENRFDDLASTDSETIDFAQIVKDSRELSNLFFRIRSHNYGDTTHFTNIDWYKEKILEGILNELSNVYNNKLGISNHRKGYVTDDPTNVKTSTRAVKRFSLEKRIQTGAESETGARYKNRMKLLDFVYENYDKITPYNISEYLNKFIDIDDKPSGKNSDTRFIETEVVLNGREIKTSTLSSEERTVLRKNAKFMAFAEERFKLVIKGVLDTIRVDNQMKKWGLSILNLDTSIIKNSPETSESLTLKSYLEKTTVKKGFSLHDKLSDCFQIDEFRGQRLTYHNLRNDILSMRKNELSPEDKEIADKLFSQRILSIKELTDLKEIIHTEKQTDRKLNLKPAINLVGNIIDNKGPRQLYADYLNTMFDFSEGDEDLAVHNPLCQVMWSTDLTNNNLRDLMCNRILNSALLDKFMTKLTCTLGLFRYLLEVTPQLKQSLTKNSAYATFVELSPFTTIAQDTKGFSFNQCLKYGVIIYQTIFTSGKLKLVYKYQTPDNRYTPVELEGDTMDLTEQIFKRKLNRVLPDNYGDLASIDLNMVFSTIFLYLDTFDKKVLFKEDGVLSYFNPNNNFVSKDAYNMSSNLSYGLRTLSFMRRQEVLAVFKGLFKELRNALIEMDRAVTREDLVSFINLEKGGVIPRVIDIYEKYHRCQIALSDESTFSQTVITELGSFCTSTLGVSKIYKPDVNNLDPSEIKLIDASVFKMFYLFSSEFLNKDLTDKLREIIDYKDYALSKITHDFNLGETFKFEDRANVIYERHKKRLEQMSITIGANLHGEGTFKLNTSNNTLTLPKMFTNSLTADNLGYYSKDRDYIMIKHTFDTYEMCGFLHMSGYVVFVCDMKQDELEISKDLIESRYSLRDWYAFKEELGVTPYL